MLKIPEKIFNSGINDVRIGLGTIHIYNKEEIEKAQAGYRYDEKTGEPIYEWFGDEFVVIGYVSCGDLPIIAKIDEEEIPIYCMFNDNWAAIETIAVSFEQFISFLKKVEATNLINKEECKKLTDEIEKELTRTSTYWSALIDYAYMVLNRYFN